MSYLRAVLSAGLAVHAFTGAWAAPVDACPRDGADAPGALHEDWLMKGWERREGDPAFVFAKRMERYYDLENTAGVFWDNFAPGDSQLFGESSRYGANWEDLQNAARSVRHGLTDGRDTIVDDRIASTALGFVGRIDRLDGRVIAFEGRSQLGWRCEKGAWKIRHEMNYAWVVTPEAIERFLGRTGKAR